MQRTISGPIIGLVEIANRVSQTRDYSLRAQRTTGDEIGQLVEAFNGMLAQVERPDRAKDSLV